MTDLASKPPFLSPVSTNILQSDPAASGFTVNPWSATPADIALAPLYRFVKGFEAFEQSLIASQQQESSGVGSTNIIPAKSTGDSKPVTPRANNISTVEATSQVLASLNGDNNNNHGSMLIRQLRESDRTARIRREKQRDTIAGELFPEIRKSLALSEETTILFDRLADSLDELADVETLHKTYASSYRSNQQLWDEISQENKAKLIQCLRSAVYAIFQLFEAREEKSRFVAHEKSLLEIVKRTDILREDIEFDDYYLEDLFDLLQECYNSLELIRLYPAAKSGTGKRINTPNKTK